MSAHPSHRRPRTRARLAALAGALVGTFAFATPATVLACPICFQIGEGPVTDGVRAAVVVLIAVTVSVLGGFGWFIVRFVRRTAALPAEAR